MSTIKPDGCVDAINPQPSTPLQAPLPAQTTKAWQTDSVPRQVKPFSAVFWIIAAWLIGTLVSELNVIGAESRPAETIEMTVEHRSADYR